MVLETLEVVILGPTMLPVNPQLLELTSQSKVISSSTYILIPTVTMIPVVLPAAQKTTLATGEESIISGEQTTSSSGEKAASSSGKKTSSSSGSRLEFR
jgi:hypothetical protein